MRQFFVKIKATESGKKSGYQYKIALNLLTGLKWFYVRDAEKAADWLARVYSLMNNADIAQLN
jgi:hypothetical protein